MSERILSGITMFKDKESLFHLKGDILEVIPFDQSIEIKEGEKYICSSDFNKEDVPTIIKGRLLTDNSRSALFFIRSLVGRSILFNCKYRFKVDKYIVATDAELAVDGITIYGEELNWFYNIRKAYNWSFVDGTGEANVELKEFDKVNEIFEFYVNGELIKGSLDVSRNLANMSTTPISLRTALNLRFNVSNDIEFINKLVWIVKNVLSILSYRNNIDMDEIELKRIYEGEKYIKWGNLYLLDNKKTFSEEETYIRERIIDFDIIKNNVSNLFQIISDGVVYTDHIPHSSVDRVFTPARFVMITAAFEWEFRHIYGELSTEESEARKDARKELNEFLDKKISASTKKKKKYFKSYKKFLNNSDMSLSEKIERVLEEKNDILNIFIKPLFELNGIEDWKYKDIAKRLQIQRNNYAHGNIDKDIDGLVILDLFILEWAIYALILNEVKLSDEDIKRAINKLFKRNVVL